MAPTKIDKDTLIPLALVLTIVGATYSMALHLENTKNEIKRTAEKLEEIRKAYVSRADLLLWIESTRASNRDLTLPPLGRQ